MTNRVLALGAVSILGVAVAVAAWWAVLRLEERIAVEAPPSAAASDDASFARDWQVAMAESEAGEDDALWDTAERWIVWDGERVMNAVLGMRDRRGRKVRLLSLWLEREADDALAWIGRLPVARQGRVLEAVFADFARRDAAGALDVADRLPSADRRVAAAAAALRVWAESAPAAAWAAAQAVDIGHIPWTAVAAERRGKLSLAVLDVWMRSGWRVPPDAVEASAEPHVPTE